MHMPWEDVPYSGSIFCTSVLPEEAEELARLAKGRHVLEIGSALGFSATVMALGGATRVTCVDPQPDDRFQQWLNNVFDAGVHPDSVAMIRGPSEVVMPQLAAQGEHFDMVFVDGLHEEAPVISDVFWALELLDPGGYLVVHDYLEECCCPDVRKVVDSMGLKGTTVGSMFVMKKDS